jgi:ADP-heptose:LPS heptosyltransferase
VRERFRLNPAMDATKFKMKEIDLYGIKDKTYMKQNFYFDKITSFFVKSKPSEINNPKKILFARNDSIGDMVLTLPFFYETRKKFPNAKITVLATKGNRSIIDKDKNVDEIIEIDLFWRRGIKGFLDYLKVLKKIKKENFDLGIDLRRSKLNTFFFLFVPKIKSRISYYNLAGGKAFLTHPLLYKKKIPILEERTDLLRPLGIKTKIYIPKIITDKEDKIEVNKFLSENGLKKYIVICPGTTTESKKYPPEKIKELIKRFSDKYPSYKIVISSGKEDKEMIEDLCKVHSNCFPLINFNLRKMVILLKKAKLAIACDGGVREIATSSGTDLISLAGPVDLEIDVPPKYFRLLHHEVPCYPCDWKKPCTKPCGVWCMELITVEEIMGAIEASMKKNLKRKSAKGKDG